MSLERNPAVMQYKLALTRRIVAHFDLRSLSGALSDRIRLTCLFGSFVFLQFTVLGLANHAGEGYLSTGQRDLVYYALQVFVILGFVLHSLYAHACDKNQKVSEIRNGIAYAAFGLFFACVAVMLFTGAGSLLYVIVSMMAALCVGMVGGAAHLRMSAETIGGAEVAKCMGFGSAAAVVLQYLLQIRQGITPLLPVFMLAAFLFLGCLLFGKDPESVSERVKEAEHTPPRKIVLSVLITAVFLLFACFYNEYIHHLQIQSGYTVYNVYSWPRLMLVPGYLLFVFIGDRKNGKYVPVTSLCIMLIALMNVALIESPESQELNMCLFYFAIAAFTSYYLLTFWRLAPGTKHPALWAPFGRILDSGMVLLTGAIHLSSLPTAVILGVDIAGVALVILLMALSGNFNLIAEKPAEIQAEAPVGYSAEMLRKDTAEITTAESPALPDKKPPIAEDMPALSENPASESVQPRNPEETLEMMRDHYDLSQREMEVLKELVLTEDKQTVISERLSVKVRTVQHHVTQIYRKTGVTTRAGLMDLYYEFRNQT